jgi:predicted nucleic acid-binding protein
VNVLIAGIWSNHSLHSRAQAWLQDKQIVLCPVTQMGFIRVSTNRKAVGADMSKAREALERFAKAGQADWIAADLSALDSHPRTSDRVTDHYLADLAAKHGLRLATFDAQLKHPSVDLIPV